MNKAISTSIAIIIVLVIAVIVGSIIIWQYFSMPESEVILEEAKDETADWKVCRNEEMGIEFQYPENWFLSISRDGLITLENRYDIDDTSQKISFLKLSGPPPETIGYGLIESKTVNIGELELTRELFKGETEYNNGKYYLRIFIPEKSILYEGDFREEGKSEFLLIFDGIFSTIKFID